MQLPSSPAWSFCIKHYLFLKCASDRTLRLFSDGNTGLVFIIKGQLKIRNEEGIDRVLPYAFVYGQLESYQDIKCLADTEILIVVFHPFGFYRLSGLPADEVRGQIIDAQLMYGHQINSLADNLKAAISYTQSILAIEAYFAALFKISANNSDKFGQVVRSIIQIKGQTTIKELTSLTGHSERKLERLFEATIGISPGKYLQIVRLHHFLSLVRSKQKPESLTMAGLESGYYDQAHLIHHFKQTTGLTPTQYLLSANPLAVNLLAVR
ncbi:MAG: helix-turn-helix transcriptional regulator [Bacteroidetes bacterium]|jgi:AraC-like DNA-binding protein|nr:helix-turn-helix transcriptional regulator [Bacteroidota bacterium]